ncbi:MAG: pentapeptide repeat-containing protein [Ilumatobacter sp.]|nr:pentapeptide repeat-containing protein [bacterium]MDG1265613.1 pentapeptide repeat-containing protein [Ilumatobacter sp.]
MRRVAVAVVVSLAVMSAGTAHAEPRSIHDSIGIDRLGSADPSTLSKPTRHNVKDCSEAVAGANLPNAILTGCDLAGANLASADLTGATLTGANLSRTDLTTSILSNAILTDVDLSGADLSDAIMVGANLTGANLDNVSGWDLAEGTAAATFCDTTMPDGNVYDRDC